MVNPMNTWSILNPIPRSSCPYVFEGHTCGVDCSYALSYNFIIYPFKIIVDGIGISVVEAAINRTSSQAMFIIFLWFRWIRILQYMSLSWFYFRSCNYLTISFCILMLSSTIEERANLRFFPFPPFLAFYLSMKISIFPLVWSSVISFLLLG